MTARSDSSFSPSATSSLLMSRSSELLAREQDRDRVGRKGFRGELSGRSWSSNLLLVTVLLTFLISAQPLSVDELAQNRTSLNQQIQVAAFQSFPTHPKTGMLYNATMPGNLSSAVDVSMIRFRSGRLRRVGFLSGGINLPVGFKVANDLRHVVLVYRNYKIAYPFFNATSGIQFVAPVVGVSVYDGTNLTNFEPLQELPFQVSQKPIEVKVNLLSGAELTNVTCVLFNDTGLATVSNLNSTSTTCAWTTLGDFSLFGSLVEVPSGKSSSSNNAWKIAVGTVGGAIVLLILLSLVVLLAIRYRERAKFANMERVADRGETLQHTLVGGGRAPAAASTRTKPVLESDYVS